MAPPDELQARARGIAAAATDPLGMLEPTADLLNPLVAVRELPWLSSELLKISR